MSHDSCNANEPIKVVFIHLSFLCNYDRIGIRNFISVYATCIPIEPHTVAENNTARSVMVPTYLQCESHVAVNCVCAYTVPLLGFRPT